jgi:hypothetical protein
MRKRTAIKDNKEQKPYEINNTKEMQREKRADMREIKRREKKHVRLDERRNERGDTSEAREEKVKTKYKERD